MRNISKKGVSFNKERQERLFRPYNFDGTELSPFKGEKEGFHRELNEVDVEAERYIEERVPPRPRIFLAAPIPNRKLKPR
jgi:hypothetical protein